MGELEYEYVFNAIQSKPHFSEKHSIDIIKDLANALKYLHEVKIAHQNLRCSNLIYTAKDSKVVKVTDFGMSLGKKNTENLHTCSEITHLAPEIILQKKKACPFQADMWSTGILLYTLVGGYPPFYDTSSSEIRTKIINCAYDFPDEYW